MKRRWFIRIILAIVFLALIASSFVFETNQGMQKKLEQTRRELRDQGFKTELSDFNLSVPPDVARRAQAVSAVGRFGQGVRLEFSGLMFPVNTNAARVTWREVKYQTENEEDFWPRLSLSLAMQQSAADDACRELLSGPIAFPITPRPDGDFLLPGIGDVRAAGVAFSQGVILELHNDNPDGAWTNLLALTRLATAWKTEPAEVSQMVRFLIASLAQSAAWETLQRDGWTDEQLSALQGEWESADFLSRLPESVAFSRVTLAAASRAARREPLYERGMASAFFHRLIESPTDALNELNGLFRAFRYRTHDAYAREIDILLSGRDSEILITKALKLPTWTAMLDTGITNLIPVRGAGGTRVGRSGGAGPWPPSDGYQMGAMLQRAAEAEATRRITVVAIALERYRRLNGTYPQSLADLAPRFLKNVPADFIDGLPLRYERMGDGQFVLYSPGTDCLDNGGVLRRFLRDPAFRRTGVDLVWPRPATVGELENLNQALGFARRLRKGEEVDIPENFQVPPSLRREFQGLSPAFLPEERPGPSEVK